MNDSQRAKLRLLAERLADVFLDECDPDKWPSIETTKGRGDRVWYKKNAMQTIALVQQIHGALRDHAAITMPAEDGDETERLINAAEKRAADYLDKHGTEHSH